MTLKTILNQNFTAGTWIFHQGDLGQCAYLVEEGEVVIVLEDEDTLIPLGVYGPGSLFGEMAIIDDQPRSAGAYAHNQCRLRVIQREHLNYRLEQADPILQICISVLMKHLRKTLLQVKSPISPLVAQSESSSKVSLEQVVNNPLDPQLKEALQYVANQAVLDPQHTPTSLALPIPIDSSSSSLFAPQELKQLVRGEPINVDSFQSAIQTLNLEQELSIAVQKQQLRLFYQPIMNIKTGQLAGFEALMRWIHPEQGLIPPSTFIPIAERSGLIIKMTYWALEEACQILVRFRDELFSKVHLSQHISDSLFMSVNFSSRDFLDPGLMTHLHDCLTRSFLPPKSLKIEITESVLMNSPEKVKKILQECQENGASVAIDDFGTGYSSLSYLQSMPADTLKIDQGFIRPMHQNERHMALVESIIHLAQRLNMKTVAEGVETAKDVEILAQLECDYVQGYHFARPMPFKEVLKWIGARWPEDEVEFLG
jgi:EAL domain-containing protein (putative c-di-GMP-specific phosphodiesterase class I)